MIAYEGNESFVFISYAHKDKHLVLPVIQGLQDRGFRVWYDQGVEVGDEWPDFIAEHLESCCGMVAFVSRNFGESNNCREELSFAKELDKTILVIYLEDRKNLRAGVRMRLSTLHYMNLGDYTNRELFINELAKAKALKPCLVHAKPAVPEPVKPAEQPASRTATPTPPKTAAQVPAKPFSQKPANTKAVSLYNQAQDLYRKTMYVEAARLYSEAAEMGYAPAQYRLGDCYYLGKGLQENEQKAAALYRMAADQGYPDAQYWLSHCYEMGRGVAKNKEKARYWCQLAADQGYQNAVDKLQTL